ncbi:MAG: hypothetical protein KAI28_06395 [Sphingomonadales bacterium]|nr:hypothetical protein [Sphingomonadales bacterium]
MAKTLRDKFIHFVTVDEVLLNKLGVYFDATLRSVNANHDIDSENYCRLAYVIRADGKGYETEDYEHVKSVFLSAIRVERINYKLESTSSRRSFKAEGRTIELRFDADNKDNCLIEVQGEDDVWVNAQFVSILDICEAHKNYNFIIQNTWTPLFVQIVGVGFGFFVSLVLGLKVAPHLSIENPFVISFLFFFLLFSNLWTYLNQIILNLLNMISPVIVLKRTNWLQKFVKGLLMTLVAGLFIYVGEYMWSFVSNEFDGLIKK